MIRPFRDGDIEPVIDVWLESTIAGQTFLPESHWRNMEAEIRELLMHSADTWVVEHEGEIVAFISLIGEMVGGLFTHPDHQGKGYGRSLVGFATGMRRDLSIEVFEQNHRAVGIYRSWGFVDYLSYVDQDSGLVMLQLMKRKGSGA